MVDAFSAHIVDPLANRRSTSVVPISSVTNVKSGLHSGSNVTIPIARVVQLHGSIQHNVHNVDCDPRVVYTDSTKTSREFEYDNIRVGDVVWTLGTQYCMDDSSSGAPYPYISSDVMNSNANSGGRGLSESTTVRMASTAWIEKMFEQKMDKRGVRIELTSLRPDSEKLCSANSELRRFRGRVLGNAVVCSDVTAHLINNHSGSLYDDVLVKQSYRSDPRHNTKIKGKLMGIKCIEPGPFLRGRCPRNTLVTLSNPRYRQMELPINQGDELAFEALYTEMRLNNLMNWSPDGIMLSQFDTDSDAKSASYLNLRDGLIVNTVVQGPALATTWTIDQNMACEVGDRVFLVLVAELNWVATSERDTLRHYEDLIGHINDTDKRSMDIALSNMESELGHGRSYLDNRRHFPENNVCESDWTSDRDLKCMERLDPSMQDEHASMQEIVEQFLDMSMQEENGHLLITSAMLERFRVMKTTSSHMVQTSAWDPAISESRMGLKQGGFRNSTTDPNVMTGSAEYVVGGWCIGKVMDLNAVRMLRNKRLPRTSGC